MRRREAKVEMKRRIILAAIEGHGGSLRGLYASTLMRYAAWRIRCDRDPPDTRLTPTLTLRGCILHSIGGTNILTEPLAAAGELLAWTVLESELQIQVLDRLERGTRWMQQHVESLREAR